MDKIELVGTTDGSGDLTVTSDIYVTGGLFAVRWIDGTFADGVDGTLSVVDGDGNAIQTLLTLTDANADAWYYPRELEDDNTGAALTTYTPAMVDGYLKLVVSSGGATKEGGAIVYIVGAV